MTQKVRFGTAGIPLSTLKPSAETGILRVTELGLSHMELEFVHGVSMKKETAEQIKKTAAENEITLSCHGSYYINLNSLEKEKQIASIRRIFDAANVGGWCGAKAITFHPAYMQGAPESQVAKTVRQNLEIVLEQMKTHKVQSRLKPETTGKPVQWGSITELLQLHNDLPETEPYFDFAHVHARNNGRFKAKKDVFAVLDEIEKSDATIFKDMNMHMSGIEYSAKGEKNHVPLQDKKNDFPWKFVLECLKEYNVHGTVVSESPIIENDALLMKKYFENL
ncbi:MAG: TIM barrel protein [Candidatus Micrarchaeota archaeon]